MRVNLKSPIFLYFIFLMVVVSPFLPDRWANDTKAILEISDGLRDQGSDSGSYYYTAVFFGAVGIWSYFFQACIAYCMAHVFEKNVNSRYLQAIICIFLTPAFLLGLVRPQKELFVFLVAYLVCAFDRFERKTKWHDILLIGCLYTFYGVLMRPYFVLIFGVFLLILILHRYSYAGFFAFVCLFVLFAFSAPNELLIQLQGSRDEINLLSRGVDEDQRTAFLNVYQGINDGYEFLINYIYAFIFLNFSFLFFWDLPSLILTAYVFSCVAFCCQAINWANPYWQRRILLFVSHLFVLAIFEPDLGSYLRHLSSVFIYLAPFFYMKNVGDRDQRINGEGALAILDKGVER